jgi:hypothetical protein
MPVTVFLANPNMLIPTKKERDRPGTLSYGQNPNIVIADTDYIADDVAEL